MSNANGKISFYNSSPTLLSHTGTPIVKTGGTLVYNDAPKVDFDAMKEAMTNMANSMPVYTKSKLEPFIEAVLDLYYSMADEEWDEATTERLEAVAEQLRIFDGDTV